MLSNYFLAGSYECEELLLLLMVLLRLRRFFLSYFLEVFSEIFENSENRPIILDMNFLLLCSFHLAYISSPLSVSLSFLSSLGLNISQNFSRTFKAGAFRNSFIFSFLP